MSRNCIVFGGTGGTGREFVDLIAKSPSWGKVIVVTRRMIPEFEPLKTDPRFDFCLGDNIMDTEKIKAEFVRGQPIAAVFNFLGTRTKEGEAMFRKVDKDLVLDSCRFAEELGAKQFTHISSGGVNSSSWFLYLRVKGECVDELKKSRLDNVSIFKPGILLERRNDFRCSEMLVGWLPFAPKIKVRDLAAKVLLEAERNLETGAHNGPKIYEQKDIERI